MKTKSKKPKMTKEQFVDKIVAVFGKECGCGIQFRGCPCNSCFHSLDDDIDWKHMSWLLLLSLRGDYTANGDLVTAVRKELKKEVEE